MSVQALRELPSVRTRCEKVYKLAQEGKVDHFTLDESKYEAIIEVCAKAINVRLYLTTCPHASVDQQKDYGTDYASVSLRYLGKLSYPDPTPFTLATFHHSQNTRPVGTHLGRMETRERTSFGNS
jgi:hypothetical protein